MLINFFQKNKGDMKSTSGHWGAFHYLLFNLVNKFSYYQRLDLPPPLLKLLFLRILAFLAFLHSGHLVGSFVNPFSA